MTTMWLQVPASRLTMVTTATVAHVNNNAAIMADVDNENGHYDGRRRQQWRPWRWLSSTIEMAVRMANVNDGDSCDDGRHWQQRRPQQCRRRQQQRPWRWLTSMTVTAAMMADVNNRLATVMVDVDNKDGCNNGWCQQWIGHDNGQRQWWRWSWPWPTLTVMQEWLISTTKTHP